LHILAGFVGIHIPFAAINATGGDVHPESLSLGIFEMNLAARLSVRQGNSKSQHAVARLSVRSAFSSQIYI
jgi:hypothetical protein